MRAIAPGKIIISGEHSVVYGKPALVMAVDRYAEATITENSSPTVSFNLYDFNTSSVLTMRALRDLKQRLVFNYRQFLNGSLGIRDVLKKPFELFQFLIITFLDTLHLKLERGINIELKSNIPIGCGMGSSAATILSVLRAVAAFFGLDFLPDRFYKLGLEAEKLQHGYSSGVDPFVSLHGGFIRFQNSNSLKLDFPDTRFYLANTGIPDVTTGECVSSVAKKFNKSRIWDDFESITLEIEKALVSNKSKELIKLFRVNHRILVEIGVVPENVQNFIKDIEQEGGAAKISGAGSAKGEKGGMVTILSADSPDHISRKYGYKLFDVKGEVRGARIV